LKSSKEGESKMENQQNLMTEEQYQKMEKRKGTIMGLAIIFLVLACLYLGLHVVAGGIGLVSYLLTILLGR
jgi:hypothetical protein